MSEDAAILRRFIENSDEDAFRALVSTHFDLVYATALRITNRDVPLAQDVAQSVFTDLARKASRLPRTVVLTGWLYQATRFAAAKAVRTEQRRRTREQEAFAMHELQPDPNPAWDQLQMILDAGMGKLNANDREAILLHYFERKNLRMVGAALGVSDDAAQKRVSRALGKLRHIFARRGIVVSGILLSTCLSSKAVTRAPSGLALSVAKSSLMGAAALRPPSAASVLLQRFISIKGGMVLTGVMSLVIAALLVHEGMGIDLSKYSLVNLSNYHNGALTKSWTTAYSGNDLATLRLGRHVFKKTPFETDGIIQLQGAEWKRRGYTFPEQIIGIPIRTTGKKIHLLHANSGMADPQGTPVAKLILHYSDGEQTVFQIRQGVEVLDWWDWPRALLRQPADVNTFVAWTGDNAAAKSQGARIRLFDTVFMNPHSEKMIQTIDYVSGMANSAPFMVAMTVER